MITYISEPYYQANKNYKKMKTQPNVKPKMHFQKNISQNPQIVNAPQTNQINNNQIIQENIQEQVIDNNNINVNSNMIPQQDFTNATNQIIGQNNSVKNSGENNNNNIQNRVQHKIQNRQKYHEENIYQISNEDPNNPNEKKTRKIKVEITREQSINSNDTNDYDNGLKYINKKTVPKELNESNLSNVSFSNRNINVNKKKSIKTKNDINKYKIKRPPTISEQLSIKEKDSKEGNVDLEMQKEKLRQKNKKLNQYYKYIKKEKEKLEQEKKLFLESKSRVINDNRKNEERLLKLEKELQEKYTEKRNEILNMKNKLKEDQTSLEKERYNMQITFQQNLEKIENEYKLPPSKKKYLNI
jgi:hypothetical protein